MQKDDRYQLAKMLEDIFFIKEHMNKITRNHLENDPVLCDSMMFRLIQISEHAGALSDEIKAKNPHVPWNEISGLRNRIVHDYGNVNLKIVYDTLVRDIPELGEMLKDL